MRIDNAQVLQTHLAAGGHVRLDGDQLVTQSGASAFFQRVGDIFRSRASIAARNDRLALAMSDLLRGAGEARGPRNLAEARPLDAARRAAHVRDAKNVVLNAVVRQAVDRAYPEETPQVRDAIARHVEAYARESGSLEQWPAPHALRSLAGDLLAAVRGRVPDLADAVRPLCRLNVGTEELGAHMRFTADGLKGLCAEYRTRTTEAGARENFDEQGFYDIFLMDAPRDRPVIGGTRIASGPSEAVVAEFRDRMMAFSPNQDEREVLTVILSQTHLSLPSEMYAQVPGRPPLGLPQNNPGGIIRIPGNLADGDSRFSLDRTAEGDAVIHVRLSLSAQGELGGVAYGSGNRQVTTGVLHYDVVVPHGQFEAGVPPAQAPEINVINMRVDPPAA